MKKKKFISLYIKEKLSLMNIFLTPKSRIWKSHLAIHFLSLSGHQLGASD